MRRIILIGYMGAGKTTIGRILGRNTGLEFFDLDWYVEDRYRTTIPKLFEEKGEDAFRQLEQRMLHEVGEFEDVVISTGGGTPCFFDNMAFMNRQADTVYLKAEPEVLQKHLMMGKSKRPLIQGKSPDELIAFIRESLAVREPFYAQAKYTLPIDLLTTKGKVQETVQTLQKMLNL
ncbi:MAG: shikimate kinase [Bacteroidaceae bacterium]|nr:shikimate kinase [Bacteroidaceae bacterium]